MPESNRYYGHSLDSRVEEGKAQVELQPGFERLLNQLVDQVLKTALPIESGVGETPLKQQQREISKQIREILASVTVDETPDSVEGQRIRKATKPFLECFLKNTFLKSIHSESYLNLVYTAGLLAKDPSLFNSFAINTGFGGTADEDINLRLPAYLLPGIGILENFYQLKASGFLNFTMPQFRVFFAPYSAIAVNGSRMNRTEVLTNTQRSISYLQQYIRKFHPAISPYIIYETEKPWEEHDQMTEVVLSFFSSSLSQSQDPKIVRSLEVLQERGRIHGNKTGADLAHVYSAMHPLLFRDALNHPPVNIFENTEKEAITLSIGGRPERLFNTIRAYLRGMANQENLETFDSNLDSSKYALQEWLALLNDGQDSNERFNFLKLPYLATLAQTTIGATPVYYKTPYDRGISNIPDSMSDFLAGQKALALAIADGKARNLEISRIGEVERDFQAMIKDVGGDEQRLLIFLDSLDLV